MLVSGVLLGQPMGGVRRHNAQLLGRAARLLEARGGSLALLAGRAPIPAEIAPGVERIASDVPAGPALRRALGEGHALRRALAAARAQGRPFDLVHVAHLPAPDPGPTPFSVLLHGLRHVSGLERTRLARFLARRVLVGALRRAALVMAVSAHVAGRASALAGRAVEVVPNGSGHLPRRARAPGAGAPLLAVGHVERSKNLALLVRALALDPGLPDLALAGAPQPGEERRLRGLAAALGVARRVRFLGPADDARLAELYAGAACVVVPSHHEGFGLAAVEAERAGAPLAVADAGALGEVAGPDVPRFDPLDPAHAARAIRAALATPADVLAARAAEVVRRFDWDASARRLVELWTRAARAGAR